MLAVDGKNFIKCIKAVYKSKWTVFSLVSKCWQNDRAMPKAP